MNQNFIDVYIRRSLVFISSKYSPTQKRVHLFCHKYPDYKKLFILHDKGIERINEYGIKWIESFDCHKQRHDLKVAKDKKIYAELIQNHILIQ